MKNAGVRAEEIIDAFGANCFVGAPRKIKTAGSFRRNDTGRVRAEEIIDAFGANCLSGLPDKAKTAGCRLRFMLEEKRKGKMKN